jgi:AraC-like DNA-binding protein
MLSGSRPSGSGPIRLSLNDTPERSRPGLYREFVSRSVLRFDVDPLDDVPFQVDVTVQALPGLHLFSGQLQGSRNRRTRPMLSDGKDDLSLIVNLGGPYLVSQNQQELVLGDGEATLVTSAEPCSLAHRAPGGVLALLFPRAQFAPLVAGVEDSYLRRIPRENPALSLLTGYVKLARDGQRMASRELQPLIVSHLYDLMSVAIGATRDATEVAQGRGVRAARLYAIKQDIARSLDQPELSLAALAARHCCTPRSVQRLFEGEGTTFTEYVLAQRLARAHRMLRDPRRSGDKIATVAYDAGFGDLSYFNRAFRRHFGVAPSDVRTRAWDDAPGSLM